MQQESNKLIYLSGWQNPLSKRIDSKLATLVRTAPTLKIGLREVFLSPTDIENIGDDSWWQYFNGTSWLTHQYRFHPGHYPDLSRFIADMLSIMPERYSTNLEISVSEADQIVKVVGKAGARIRFSPSLARKMGFPPMATLGRQMQYGVLAADLFRDLRVLTVMDYSNSMINGQFVNTELLPALGIIAPDYSRLTRSGAERYTQRITWNPINYHNIASTLAEAFSIALFNERRDLVKFTDRSNVWYVLELCQ